MTKSELDETLIALKRTRDDVTKSQKAALKYLQELGLVDKKGQLVKRYRSPKASKAA